MNNLITYLIYTKLNLILLSNYEKYSLIFYIVMQYQYNGEGSVVYIDTKKLICKKILGAI